MASGLKLKCSAGVTSGTIFCGVVGNQNRWEYALGSQISYIYIYPIDTHGNVNFAFNFSYSGLYASFNLIP